MEPAQAMLQGAAAINTDVPLPSQQALQSHVTVIDCRGRILFVNDAWKAFALGNGADPGTDFGEAANYLDTCRAGAASDPLSAQALAGIEAVLAGTLPQFTMEYPYHGPHENRHFVMTVAPLDIGDARGAVISHLDITPIRQAAEAQAASESRFRAMFENAAVGMAHGYYMVTGKPQAVMLHTNVGTANSINMLINASRDRTPIFLTSGKSPVTEDGPSGTRNNYIHWAQEMFDQAGMLREVVKWDYEMRRGDQAWGVVERGMELAMSSPRGPVYLMLPREVLGEEISAISQQRPARAVPAAPHPAASDIARLADWIAAAKHPLIITAAPARWPRMPPLWASWPIAGRCRW